MKGSARSTAASVRPGDVVIAAFLLAAFVVGYAYAQSWPFRAALFPQLLSIAGMSFAALKLIGFGLRIYRGRSAAAPAPGDPAADTAAAPVDVHDRKPTDQSLEYVFGTAGGRAWAAALAWVAAFFLSLWLFGVFVTVPLFALAYLRVAGGAGWLGATVYAAVSGGVLWLVFQRLLTVPMPTGIL